MGEIKIRRLDDWVIDVYRRRAERSGQSIEEEVRRTLKESALVAQRRFGERAKALREKLRMEHGEVFDSAALMSDARDENNQDDVAA